MKRITIWMIVVLVLLTSCNTTSKSSGQGEEKLTIATSFYPMYVFTKNVVAGVEGVELFNMTAPQTGCLHDYQLTLDDMKSLEKADVFIINGLGMESFLDRVIAGQSNTQIVEASKGIPTMEDEHGINPHVWVGFTGAIAEVDNIAAALSEIDPANTQKYTENAANYTAVLTTQREMMNTALETLQSRKIITFHEAFPYFAKEFNLEIVDSVEEQNDTMPTPTRIKEISETIRVNDIKALFIQEQSSDNAAKIIADETGIQVYYLDLMVTGEKDAPADSYQKAMEKNLAVLLEALG